MSRIVKPAAGERRASDGVLTGKIERAEDSQSRPALQGSRRAGVTRPPNGRLNHAANAGHHGFADRGFDLYSTPPEAVRALLSIEKLPHQIWEPAAGRGNIVKTLREAGHAVIASDITDYGFPLHYRRDFLLERKMPAGCTAILTNPPYRLTQQFVAHALGLAPLVAMLLRLSFLESKRRTSILGSGRLARVHVFRNRLPMMHRDGWAGPKASSSIPFAWYVWSRDHNGPAQLYRMSWEGAP